MPESKTEHPSDAAPWALLMAATAALGLWSWSRLDGAPLADVVEYLERTQALVRGEALIDAQPIRAIGVSLLHAPLLWLADRLGIAHGPWVLGVAGILHIALTCLLVVATVVFARRLAGAAHLEHGEARLAGWAAGALALACPTLLQYAPMAMTDIPSGAALTAAFAGAFFGPATARRALVSGALLGASALAAFKAIPLVGLGWLATLAVRSLGEGLRPALRFAALQLVVIAALALLQGAADLWTYGAFAEALRTYLLINFGQVLAKICTSVHLDGLAESFYFAAANAIDTYPREVLDTDEAVLRGLTASTFYFDNFKWVLAPIVVPFLALGAAFGLGRSAGWRAPRRSDGDTLRARGARLFTVAAPLAIAGLFALATASKGSREIRIWLPIVPLLCAFVALGLLALAGVKPRRDESRADGPRAERLRAQRPRAMAAALVLGFAVLQGCMTLRLWNANEYAAFGRAARALASYEDVGATEEGEALSVVSSYHWAVLFRTPGSWTLGKVPHQLSGLDGIDRAGQRATLEMLGAQDALILHSSLLTNPFSAEHPWREELFDLVAHEFHVAAAFWDREVDPGVGMVFLLTREVPPGEQLRSLSRTSAAPPSAAPHALRLERQLGDVREVVELAGLRATPLPGDGLVWLEVDLDRRSEAMVAQSYAIHLDVRDKSGDRGFTVVRVPRWGKANLAALGAGTRLTEGVPIAPDQGPLDRNLPAEPLDPLWSTATLWFDVATSIRDAAGHPIVNGRLEPMDPTAGDHAERDDVPPGGTVSDDGYRYSGATGALLLGTLLRMERQTTLRLERPLAGQ